MKPKLILIVSVWIAMTMSAFAQTGSAASSLCLYCQEPDKTYRCSVIGDHSVNPQITKLYCLIKTAKEQKHARCRVKEKSAQGCDGATEVTYLYEGPNIPGLTDAPSKRNTGINRLKQQEEAVKQRHEPGTLAEMTKQSLDTSKKNFKKVGKNTKKVLKKTGKVIEKGAKSVGGAVAGAGKFIAKTTVNTVKCVFTLFNNCSNADISASSAQTETPSEADGHNAPIIAPEQAEKPFTTPPAPPEPGGTVPLQNSQP